jgi:hypothetical protein
LLETTQDTYICEIAAENLEEIDPGNPKAIEALIKVLETALLNKGMNHCGTGTSWNLR